jgi:hypothetical protein
MQDCARGARGDTCESIGPDAVTLAVAGPRGGGQHGATGKVLTECHCRAQSVGLQPPAGSVHNVTLAFSVNIVWRWLRSPQRGVLMR